MKKLIAAALLLGSTVTPALAQESYRAVGTEPFWSLTIGPRTTTFEAPGQRPVVAATPKVIHGFAGEIWQGKRIGVNTVHKQCSDGMSDRTYRNSVTVTVDGRRYEGCGGGVVDQTASPAPPRNLLLEGDWSIQSINGRNVAPRTSPTINFRGQSVSGNASCNRFNGSFDFARGRLNVGPLASTRMACLNRAVNAQESSVLQILRERLTVSSNRGGKLVLTARGGKTLTLAPRRPR
ncbi:MAG: META domain-containing protein [Pseudomonadota bacterium]